MNSLRNGLKSLDQHQYSKQKTLTKSVVLNEDNDLKHLEALLNEEEDEYINEDDD